MNPEGGGEVNSPLLFMCFAANKLIAESLIFALIPDCVINLFQR
jgi:hypothetical protein